MSTKYQVQRRDNGVTVAATALSSTDLTVAVPAGATTGFLAVTNAAGSDTAEVHFVVTESDENTWVEIDADDPDFSTLLAVCWSGEKFVAVGGADKVYVSSDGVSWTGFAIQKTVALWDVIWGDGQFVAVGTFGNVHTSPGGVTWTEQQSNVEDHIRSVAWSGSGYVATGDDFGSPPNYSYHRMPHTGISCRSSQRPFPPP